MVSENNRYRFDSRKSWIVTAGDLLVSLNHVCLEATTQAEQQRKAGLAQDQQPHEDSLSWHICHEDSLSWHIRPRCRFQNDGNDVPAEDVRRRSLSSICRGQMAQGASFRLQMGCLLVWFQESVCPHNYQRPGIVTESQKNHGLHGAFWAPGASWHAQTYLNEFDLYFVETVANTRLVAARNSD